MNREIVQQRTTASAADTEAFAGEIGRRVRGGEVIELVSDLGGGKTTFVRGLARGMGYSEKVSSPTFTISHEYKTPRHALVHFDFYRLTEPGLMADELAESMNDPHAVIVIEWGDIVANVLPKERMTIHIQATSENGRAIRVQYPESLGYLTDNATLV